MYLRALADFDNYRRRVERESEHIARSGKREIILSLLEVLDGFDRAFQHAEKNQSALWEGVQAIHRQLLAVLQAQGIAPFDSVGHDVRSGAARSHRGGTIQWPSVRHRSG